MAFNKLTLINFYKWEDRMHRESCVYWVGLQGILSLTDREHIPVIESIPISFISAEQNKSATSIPLIIFYYTFNVEKSQS